MEGIKASERALVVLYASQTGNSQDVAERIGREAVRRLYSPVLVRSMDSFNFGQLPRTRLAVFVAATTGQGDPPDNMKHFWHLLLRRSLAAGCLSQLHYALFGLGDSGYQKYNITAKKLDRRLQDLGAQPLLPRGLGDDQHPTGYETVLDPWLKSLWAACRLRAPLPLGLSEPPLDDATVAATLGPPKFLVALCPASEATHACGGQCTARCARGATSFEAAQRLERERLAAIAMMERAVAQADWTGTPTQVPQQQQPGVAGRSSSTPVLARLVRNERITAPDIPQDVRHIEFDISGLGLDYEPGDILNVIPSPDPALLDAFMARCGVEPESMVSVTAAGDCPASNGGRVDVVCGAGGALGGCQGWQRNGGGNDQRVGAGDGGSGEGSCGEGGDGGMREARSNGLQALANGSMAGGGGGGSVNGAVDPPNLQPGGTEEQWLGVGEGPEWVRVAALVGTCLDFASASPRRYFFEVLSHFAQAEHEVERLQYFATAQGRDDLYNYNQREGRNVLEVLEDFPTATPPLHWLLQVVPSLKSRAFSISSSLRAHPGRLHITVAVVEWRTPYKRRRKGLCSNWLAGLDPSNGEVYVPVWLSKGSMRLPPPEVPLIMVGPGTGCAPFRAFLEERASLAVAILQRQHDASSASHTLASNAGDLDISPFSVSVNPPGCQSSGVEGPLVHQSSDIPSAAAATADADAAAGHPTPCLFFFGCRQQLGDFLYRDQWLSYTLPGGVLSDAAGGGFFVAFSRDQPHKVYVTHRIREQRKRVWALLQAGAFIYVAGSANKMPSDVAAALESVAVDEGGMTPEAAAAWLKQLERRRRYHVETWS